jgi:hypothetical protein
MSSSGKDNISKKNVSHNPFAGAEVLLAMPTTESQREMWATLEMDADASLCYNESVRVSLDGVLNQDVLAYAFKEVLRRHDALRSVFSNDGKTFMVTDDLSTTFNVMDLSNDTNQETKIQEFI